MSRRATAIAVALVALLVVVATPIVAVELGRPADGRTLVGVEVESVDVGDLTEEQARERLAELAGQRQGAEVVVTGDDGTATTTREDVGHEIDAEATLAAVMDRGRQSFGEAGADLWASWRGEPIEVDLVERLDEDAATAWAEDVAEALSREPRDAELTVETDEEPVVEVTGAEPGTAVDASALAAQLTSALDERVGSISLGAPEEPVEPAIDDDDAAAAREEAEALVAGEVTLTNPSRGDDVTLSAEEVAAAVVVTPEPDGDPGERLVVTVDPEALEEVAGERLADAGTDPIDADISLSGGEVVIGDSAEGFEVDAAATAEQIVAAANDDDRVAELGGDVVEPDRSTEDAEELGIVEPVSEFTTEHACCEPRVDNIQRMADMVAGEVVEPGESFSINDHVGPRTREAGFAEAPVILDGEFEDLVGGGTSQFATTFFNAAFFAGVQLDEFQPHSYYISRYPEGREATLSYGSLDVVFTNDTDYGILIDTSYTGTSITVTFWSTDHLEVEASDSGRMNVRSGEVGDGFDIEFTRTITYPDGETETETWFHRYNPQDADAGGG